MSAIRETDAAWAAGLIDGEGCLAIYRTSAATRAPWYQLNVRVVMTDRAALDRLTAIFGFGKLRLQPGSGARRASWRWFVGRREHVATLLAAIRPHLVTKAKEADILLRFLQSSAQGPEIYRESRGAKYRRWPSSAALAAIVLVLCAVTSALAGEVLELMPGQPAPAGGLLFDAEASRKLVEDVRDARAAAGIIETLKAENAAKDEQLRELQHQVEALKAEAQARAIAMAIAEDREKRRQEDESRIEKALARAEQAIERSDKALERAQARIESLERRAFWQSLFGPLGLVLGFAAGAF